eukprot:1759681-Amphidinium_carterae.2
MNTQRDGHVQSCGVVHTGEDGRVTDAVGTACCDAVAVLYAVASFGSEPLSKIRLATTPTQHHGVA